MIAISIINKSSAFQTVFCLYIPAISIDGLSSDNSDVLVGATTTGSLTVLAVLVVLIAVLIVVVCSKKHRKYLRNRRYNNLRTIMTKQINYFIILDMGKE